VPSKSPKRRESLRVILDPWREKRFALTGGGEMHEPRFNEADPNFRLERPETKKEKIGGKKTPPHKRTTLLTTGLGGRISHEGERGRGSALMREWNGFVNPSGGKDHPWGAGKRRGGSGSIFKWQKTVRPPNRRLSKRKPACPEGTSRKRWALVAGKGVPCVPEGFLGRVSAGKKNTTAT